MQNKKKLGLVLCLIALLVVGTLCLAACTKKDARSFVTFEGIEEIHAPVGTVTEESLLAGVKAVDSNGKNKDVTVDLGGADLSKPGRYLIEYKAGDSIKREAVYLYGDISFQINGQNLEGDRLEIDFATAINSLHFAKIASAKDSFGKEITATLVDGDKFAYAAGEYTAKYTATDKAGQTVEKTVTYTVTSDIEMTVQSGVSVKYEQDSVTFKVNLDGEKDVWLMANGGLVSIADYTVTETGLVLKSSYFRTLAPGENTLKLCSVNGSTDFAFTVVDTGKPLFTFDSIYRSNIIAGSPVVYKMPKAQIAGHEYSYTFKVTKNGVAYKAEQKGNNLLITTTSGKNADAGMYDITVTATNKADTSKKTTIKRDFRVYSNQTEIDGWKFGNDGNGSSLVNVDLSDEGYYRTSWLYTAKSPNSWNGRLFWADATKATFQTITFDFKVTSLGIAEKENGPVKYVGKNDLATIPLSCSTMSGEGIAMMFFDQNGKVVDMSELKMNTWYTVKLDVSEIQPETTTAIAWYFGVSNKWQATMYIADMNFWTYEGAGVQNVYKDADKTVSFQRNGGKSNLTSATVDGESVIRYTVTDKHMPSTPIKRALKVTMADKSKEVVSIDFKYNSEPKNVSGEALAPTMFVHDVDYRNDGVFGANYAIVDENGDPVVDIEVGKWYTLWITTEGRQNYLIYPMGEISEQITCDISFKNLKSYDYDLGIAKMVAGYAKVAHVSLYKNNEDKWGYSYTSYTGWHTDANTAWNRRPLIKVEEGATEVRFRFKFDVSEYIPVDTTESVKNLQLWAALESASGPTLVTTIMDEEFNEVAAGEREVGVWYTAFVTRADGGALPTTFNLLPGGYADGGKGTIVNLDIELTDLKGYKSTDPVTITNPDNNISITGTTLSQEENSTVIKHVLVEENAPYSPANKAIALTVLDETKQVISMKFTVNKMNSIEDEPMPAWVRVETKTGYDGNYVVIDENGDACKYVEAGKTYTLFITRPEFVKAAGGLYGQSDNPTEFSIYLTGKNGPQFADVDITEMKLHEVTEATTVNGGLTYQTKLIHGNATYYEYDGKWNIAYTSHYSLYRGSPTATDNSAENREFFVTHHGKNAVQLRFKLRFVEGTANGAPEVGFIAAGQTVSFYKDGALVTNREAGVWYDVVISKGSENISDSFTIYGGAYNNNYPVDFQYQIADLQVMTPEDFPDIMVTTSTSIGAAVWQYTEADGWHWFIPNNGVNIAAEHRQAIVTLPEDGMYKLTYEVKFNEVTGDGLPYMGLMQGVNKYYDLETSEYVGSGNGCLLETGKWYKVEYATNNQANMGTTPWTFAYIGGFGVGNASLSIRNVEATGATSHTVSFDLNYEGAGKAPDAITVDKDAAYGELPTVTREGYEFGGWYTDAACSGEAVSATTTVSASHTLYAKWILLEAPVVEFSTPGALADPVMSHVGGKVQYTITGSTGSAVSSAERSLTVTVLDEKAIALSFEMKLSNLENLTASISGADSALNVKFYNAEGTEVTTLTADAWYKLVVTKADGSAFGTTAWNLGYLGGTGRGTGKLDVEIRNVVVTLPEIPKAEVSFDLNYAGATGTPENMQISEGEAYGTLPIVTREGYEFGGWYTDAACSGEAVSATTTVSASHTLYAKWTYIEEDIGEDTNPVVIVNNAEYNSNNAKMTHSVLGGKHVYTYTTRGVAIPTASAYGRRVKVSFPAGQQYVAVEFRFTEAYHADGVTEFAPSLGVFCNNEGNGGNWISTVNIFDSTGARVTGSNNQDGLTVGEWYTLVIGTKSATDHVELWTAHNLTTEAPVLTMEIRDRACTTNAGLMQDAIKLETVWGDFADPVPAYVDGSWCYSIGGSKQSVTAEHRQLNVTLTDGNVSIISFEFKMNGLNGTAVSIPGGATKTITNLDGSAASELVADTWYKLTAVKDGGFGTARFILGYLGGWANGAGLNMFIRNITLTAPVNVQVSFDLNYAGAQNAPTSVTVTGGSAYGNLPAVTREGYTFAGWFMDAAGTGSAITDKSIVTASQAHTLYAKWIKNASSVDVSFEVPYSGYYTNVEATEYEGALTYKGISDNRGDPTNQIDRRAHLKIANTSGDTISMKVMIETTTGTPRILIGRSDNSAVIPSVVTDKDGNVIDNAEMQLGQWYTITWTANGGAHYQIQPFDGSGAKGTFYMKDFQITSNAPATYDVSFNLNYEGAQNAPATITREEGAAYGTLPVVAREGYTFGGWYLNAECSGAAVSATTTVSASHTLYAKWTAAEVDDSEDTNPVRVVVRDAANLSMSVDYVGGRHVYTTTTRGVSSPGTAAWQWGTGIEVPLGSTHWAVTFRIMEAYAEDGVTPIDPTMSIWQSNLTSGTSAQIYDAETGVMVSNDNGNYARGQKLEIGKWYTVVSNVPDATKERHYLYPCQQYSGKALITMEIAERAYYTGDFRNGYVVSTPDTFADPMIAYTPVDGWHQVIRDSGAAISAWARRTYVTIPNDGAVQLTYEAKLNSISGDATSAIYVVGSKGQLIYDLETGELLGTNNGVTLELGKWYKFVTYKSDKSNLGTSYEFCYPGDGSHNAGNCSVSFRNFAAYDYSWSTDSGQNAASIGLANVDDEQVWRYTNYVHPITNDPWGRRMNLTIDNETGDVISMKVKIVSVVDNEGNAAATRGLAVHSSVSTTLPAVFVDENGSIVDNANMELGKWYTMSFVSNGTASYAIWTFSGYAQGEILVKDISVDKVESPFTYPPHGSYYANVTPFAAGDGIAYMTTLNSRGDGTNQIDRRIHLNVESANGDTISMKVMIGATTGTPRILIGRSDNSAVIPSVVTDKDGNVVDNAAMQLGQWYTITWTANGGEHYQIQPFDGSGANGTYYMKDITVTPAA